MNDDPPSQNSKNDSRPPGDLPKPANSREPLQHSQADSQTPDAKQKLQSLLAGLWDRNRQTITERIETLEQARSLAAANNLDESTRLRAVDSAHKLAGVLGTFGLPHGTELAREAEEVFGRQAAIGAADVARLDALLEDLASMVRAASSYPGADPR